MVDSREERKEIKEVAQSLIKNVRPQIEIAKTILEYLKPQFEMIKAISGRIQPQVEISNRIFEAMKPAIEMSKRLKEFAKPQIEMSNMIREISRGISGTYISSLNNWFPPLFDSNFLRSFEELARKYNNPEFREFKEEWGWVINKKSIRAGDYFFGLYKKHGSVKFKDKFNRVFYHKKNLNIVLKSVKKKYPLRYYIIKEAFTLHSQRKYSFAIILMLPQVEGIIWDLGMRKNIVRRGYNSNFLRRGRRNQKIDLIKLSKKLFSEDKFHNIIAVEIFAEGFRNKVLHGRNIYCGKEREVSRWKSTLLILTLWRLCDE